MSKPIWWHLIDRAYKMMEMSGVGKVTEHNPDHNDPIIAWMSDARVYLRSVPEQAPPTEEQPIKRALPAIDDTTRREIIYWASQKSRPWDTSHEERLMKFAAVLYQIYDLPRSAPPSPLAELWPNPDDWNLVCPKCGAPPNGICGWVQDCPTGLARISREL